VVTLGCLGSREEEEDDEDLFVGGVTRI
jgi:hypothetical protein